MLGRVRQGGLAAGCANSGEDFDSSFPSNVSQPGVVPQAPNPSTPEVPVSKASVSPTAI